MGKSRRTSKSSSPLEVDLLKLCEHKVHSISDDLANNGGNLLNQRQCQDLSSKLSKTIHSIRELVLHSGASALSSNALTNLYRHLEKAKLLVNKCREKDWCAAAVFQIQNENTFREILLDLGLCYNAIYEQTKSTSGDWNVHPGDLRQSSVFEPAPDSDVLEDQQELQKRLADFAKPLGHSRREKVVLMKQCLARYLLVKLKCTSDRPQTSTLDTCSAILWRKETEPTGTWGNSHFLGAGSGASGVCKTKWMGIPCAKKEFHPLEAQKFFLKEASILAHLKHPCVVNFLCCGNGQKQGDRFIAMELMEKNLFNLIEEQLGVHFSLPVVLDIIVQIARGMCYLHDRGVAHRDLKPQNVVVNKLTSPHIADHFCVKLVDFGMSKTKVEVSKSNTMTALGIGTTRYRAPELHPKAHPVGKGKAFWFKADVYSFALTCAHLLSLKTPFGDTNISELYNELMHELRPELPIDCPEELVSLIRDCWDTRPRSRPSFMVICSRLEIFRHKILRGFSTVEQGLHEEAFEFVTRKMKEQSSMSRPLVDITDDEVEETDLETDDTVEDSVGGGTSVSVTYWPYSLAGPTAAPSGDGQEYGGQGYSMYDPHARQDSMPSSTQYGRQQRTPTPTQSGNPTPSKYITVWEPSKGSPYERQQQLQGYVAPSAATVYPSASPYDALESSTSMSLNMTSNSYFTPLYEPSSMFLPNTDRDHVELFHKTSAGTVYPSASSYDAPESPLSMSLPMTSSSCFTPVYEPSSILPPSTDRDHVELFHEASEGPLYPASPYHAPESPPSMSLPMTSSSYFTPVYESFSMFPPSTNRDHVELFLKADVHRAGTIDAEELRRVLIFTGKILFHPRTVRLMVYLSADNLLDRTRIGPRGWVNLWRELHLWYEKFMEYDRDHNGTIDMRQLQQVFLSLQIDIPPTLLDLLVQTYGVLGNRTLTYGTMDFFEFVECGFIVKGLTEKFREYARDGNGTATFDYTSFLLTIVPFIAR